MNVVKFKVVNLSNTNEDDILLHIERAGRICYKSEDRITPHSAVKFVLGLIKNGHHAMLEHHDLSVLVTTDRGVSHEIVRHRIASYAQESTRFCCYKGGVTFLNPEEHFTNPTSINIWLEAMEFAEKKYLELLANGETPQMARTVLPSSTKTEIVIKMNIREWFHFFNLRNFGVTGVPHPQMKEVAAEIFSRFCEYYPTLFSWMKKSLDELSKI